MGKRDFFRMRLTYSPSFSGVGRRFKVPLNKLQNASGVSKSGVRRGKFLIRRPSVLLQLPALLISETQAGWTRDGGGARCHVRLLQNSKSGRGQASAFG